MKFVFYAAIAFAVFIGLSLVSFWLAVRPPRLTVPLAKIAPPPQGRPRRTSSL